DHRCSAGHRLDDAVPEWLLEADQMEERVSASEQTDPLHRPDRPDEPDPIAVDLRSDLLVEVPLVLDDPGDGQQHPGTLGDLDRLGGTLVRVDTAEEEEVAARC